MLANIKPIMQTEKQNYKIKKKLKVHYLTLKPHPIDNILFTS